LRDFYARRSQGFDACGERSFDGAAADYRSQPAVTHALFGNYLRS
jgi:hypothetical protein